MFSLIFDANAAKELQKIDRPHQIIIKKKLEILAADPAALKNDIVPLKSTMKDLYRLRVGNYRIIYRQKRNEMIILIIRIGHRKNVYEGM